MSYIYMDESGCLGFDFEKEKTSQYFVVTFLFVKNERPLHKLVKKIVSSLHKKGKQSFTGALHCNREYPRTRIKLLTELAKQDVSLMCIYLNKKSVYTKLQDEKTILYNYVTNILLDRIFTKKLIDSDTFQLIASRRETNKFLNNNFKTYLSSQALQKHNIAMPVQICSPEKDKCLQVVDFASWAIFRKYEHQDESYYNHIKSIIIEEKSLFG